jgi:hypothetical protein
MSGPIVRSGPSPQFSKNWDSVFGKGGKKSAVPATKKEASKGTAKGAPKAAKKPAAKSKGAKKAAPKKAAKKGKK